MFYCLFLNNDIIYNYNYLFENQMNNVRISFTKENYKKFKTEIERYNGKVETLYECNKNIFLNALIRKKELSKKELNNHCKCGKLLREKIIKDLINEGKIEHKIIPGRTRSTHMFYFIDTSFL